MVNLECNVASCIHNNDRCCCKDIIQVSGECACRKDETKCASYDEGMGERATNIGERPKHMLDVKCSATNCIYNEDYICHAGSISISGQHAERVDETKCASFEMN